MRGRAAVGGLTDDPLEGLAGVRPESGEPPLETEQVVQAIGVFGKLAQQIDVAWLSGQRLERLGQLWNARVAIDRPDLVEQAIQVPEDLRPRAARQVLQWPDLTAHAVELPLQGGQPLGEAVEPG